MPVPSSAIPLEEDGATSFGFPDVSAWFHFCEAGNSQVLFATRETAGAENIQSKTSDPVFFKDLNPPPLLPRLTPQHLNFHAQNQKKRNTMAIIYHF